MKVIKNVLWVLIGVVISCGCSVFAVSRYFANQVQYSSQKSLLAVNNVGDALDELYAQASFGNPTGTIITYMGNNAPSGYLKCDGTIYNISEYGNLANQIKTEFGSYNYFGGDGTTTFAVPDLRGEFLRGTGNNSHENQGNGASVGKHQDATTTPNIEFYPNTKILGMYTNSNSTTNFPKNVDYMSKTGASGMAAQLTGTTFSQSGSNMDYASRPTNTSVLYVIKY